MKTFINLSVLTLLFVSITPSATFAKGKKSPSASPRATPAADVSDRITALSLTSVIVTLYANHQSKEYKVTPATRFTVNGQPNELSGLAVGMAVAITALPNDPTTAAVVDAKSPKRKYPGQE